MERRNVFATAEELEKLQQLLESARKFSQRDYLESLRRALRTACVVDAQHKPANVVTMEAAISMRDLANGDTRRYWLVFPRDADMSGNRVSVLSHLGSSLLGRRVGELITLKLPWGQRRFSIEAITCAEHTRSAA